MRIHLISIGDELLIGQTVNTNAAWMGQELTMEGWVVSGTEVIADKPKDIVDALDRGLASAEAVLITGGLGPTKDDVTKHVLASYFDTPLVMHEPIAEAIEAWFNSRNVPFLEVNRLQAMLPEACTVLPNPLGTASGMWFERDGKVVVSMPGVPYEMEGLMTQEVLPRLRAHFELPTTLYETVVTAGIGESSLAALVASWEDGLPAKGVSLAYLPSPGQVKMRLGRPRSGGRSGEVGSLDRIGNSHVVGAHRAPCGWARQHRHCRRGAATARSAGAIRVHSGVMHRRDRRPNAHGGAGSQRFVHGFRGGLRQPGEARGSGRA